jgi:hypothetical protein
MTGRAFGVPRLVNIAVGSDWRGAKVRFEATALNHARPAENKEVGGRKEGGTGKMEWVKQMTGRLMDHGSKLRQGRSRCWVTGSAAHAHHPVTETADK